MNKIKYTKIKKTKLCEIMNSIFDNLSRDIKYEIISEYISDNQNHVEDIRFPKYEDLKSFKINLRDFVDISNNYILFEVYRGSFEVYQTLLSDYKNNIVEDYIEKLKNLFGYSESIFNEFFVYFGDVISRDTVLDYLNKSQELILLIMSWFAAIKHNRISKNIIITINTEYMNDEEIEIINDIANDIVSRHVFYKVTILIL